MSRLRVVSLVILAVLACGIAYYLTTAPPRTMVLTGIVTTHDVVVSAQIEGRLARLLVNEGDTVRPGQLLAVLQPQELAADRAYYTYAEQSAAAQVNEARAALAFQESQTRDQIRQAEAALAAARAQVSEAAADLERTRLDYERAAALFRESIIPAQQLDQARAAFEAQKAHVAALQKQFDAQRAAVALARSTETEIQARRSQLQSTVRQRAAAGAQKDKADVRLDYTDIRAPIPAVVSVSAARQGEVVAVGQPIVSLINPDDLWIRIDVAETVVDRIRLGDHFTVRFPSGMEKQGTVFFRGVDADYATQRDVSRTKRDIKTFEVRIRVDNRDRRIWPGLTAYVTLPLDLTG